MHATTHLWHGDNACAMTIFARSPPDLRPVSAHCHALDSWTKKKCLPSTCGGHWTLRLHTDITRRGRCWSGLAACSRAAVPHGHWAPMADQLYQSTLYQCTPKMYSPRQFYLYSSSFTCASGHGHAMLASMSAEPFPSTGFEAPHTAPTRGVLSRRVRR